MKLRISATDRNLANWNLSRLGGTRKYNVDFVNELTVLNESSLSRVFVILTIWSFGPQKISFGFHLLVVKKVKVETACIQLQW